jgi:hypothetical protein
MWFFERSALRSLPAEPFDMSQWSRAHTLGPSLGSQLDYELTGNSAILRVEECCGIAICLKGRFRIRQVPVSRKRKSQNRVLPRCKQTNVTLL